jgi:thiol-disulfide isomerase/thioredoxin
MLFAMKSLEVTGLVLLTLTSLAQTTPNSVWTALEESRSHLPGVHQEFEYSISYKTRTATQAIKQTRVIDMSQGLWREVSLGGGGDHIRIFDGTDILTMEEGGNEFVRVKRSRKDPPSMPAPYVFREIDWKRAKELTRQPCGFVENDHPCVILQLPLKTTTQVESGRVVTVDASAVVKMDTTTGLLILSRIQESVANPNSPYLKETIYSLKRYSANVPSDPNLFKLPSNLQEVRELSRWDASRINKQLAGKPAPALAVLDMSGQPVSLDEFKGKTVLLDFWTTWCPPCRADGPALEKLNQKYGKRELAIVGVSVDEERGVVEKFLKDNAKTYPVILTSENEMPRPYQISVFPTYIVIDQAGNVASAAQGDKGFGELRNLLRKAGMDTE